MNDEVRGLFDWLVDGAPGADGAAEVVIQVNERLLASGIPLDRGAAFVRTLHTHIIGRAFFWRPDQPVETRELTFSALATADFKNSPVAAVGESRMPLRRRLVDPECPRDYPVITNLDAEGITDYLAVPLNFLSGESHAMTFATKDPNGFSEGQVANMLEICRPLARVGEILALTRTAVNLLNTYVGRNAGERIIAGKIRRGDTDSIRAAIWFSDLRGFTELAGSTEAPELIALLNEVFECQVPAIEEHGGEVLKFIGDGLLAIFPIPPEASHATATCDGALAAATDAFAALRRLNETRAGRSEVPVRFGLALHVGDVAYGNIGS
ncbi:MAG: adenylate/guanylate cyclase domain-containing protein, partial [Polyangiaceae bacterium]